MKHDTFVNKSIMFIIVI